MRWLGVINLTWENLQIAKQRGFEGVHKIHLGVWGGGGGRCEPPSGVRGAVSPLTGCGAEPRKILKLTLFRG